MDIQLEKDIRAIRETINVSRQALKKDFARKKAKEAGVSPEEYSEGVLEELENSVAEFRKKLETAFYGPDGESEGTDEFAREINEFLRSIREHRRKITGGHIEDALIKILMEMDKKIMDHK